MREAQTLWHCEKSVYCSCRCLGNPFTIFCAAVLVSSRYPPTTFLRFVLLFLLKVAWWIVCYPLWGLLRMCKIIVSSLLPSVSTPSIVLFIWTVFIREFVKLKPKQLLWRIATDFNSEWTNCNSKQWHATSTKRGKMRVSKSWLVLILLLIGWESGVSFADQSQRKVKVKPK